MVKIIFSKDGASVIGLDIIFDKDSREPQEDIKFINSVEKAGNVSNALHFAESDSMNWRYVMKEEPENFKWQNYSYRLPDHQIIIRSISISYNYW